MTTTDRNQSRSLKFDSLKIQKQLSAYFISKRERNTTGGCSSAILFLDHL
jgi:hypothetical protein